MQKVRKKQMRQADRLNKDSDTRDFSQFTADLPTQDELHEVRQQWLDSNKEDAEH